MKFEICFKNLFASKALPRDCASLCKYLCYYYGTGAKLKGGIGGGEVATPQNTRNPDWHGKQRNWQGNFFHDLANYYLFLTLCIAILLR